MNTVNSIVICREKYKSQEEFQNAIRDAVMVLLSNEYIMTVRYDDCDIVVIDFNYGDNAYGDAYPYWLTPEEYESIIWNSERENEE